jgi:hypothetical protein
MSEELTQEQFRENINTRFTVIFNSEEPLELELVECNDLGTTPRQEQYSLIFTGPPNRLMPQGIYSIVHESLGELSLFLVPIKRDNVHLYYEAVFNRFKELSV